MTVLNNVEVAAVGMAMSRHQGAKAAMEIRGLLVLIVGGIGSLSGAVVGVVAVTLIIELLRGFEDGVLIAGHPLHLLKGSQEIGLSVVLALILIFRPGGLTNGREIWVDGSEHTSVDVDWRWFPH
jgi:ABC-type branched-subunit amino acid transport system permease subunit